MTLWGYRHDYDTMGVPSYNETKGVTVMTMILWGYSHDDDIMVGPPLTGHYGGPSNIIPGGGSLKNEE